MAIHFSPDTAYAKEMRKWEANYTEFGAPERPYVKREYPMMLHRAAVLPQGGIDIVETLEVGTAEERSRREGDGFYDTPDHAIAKLKAQQTEHASLAAEREWEKRHRLSPGAVAEVEAVEEAAGAKHLATIAEAPRQKRRYTKRDPAERAQRSQES